MSADIIEIPMEHIIPAGRMGPEPVKLDVRAYLVPHDSGLVLVDTGMDATGSALDLALAQRGATWADVSHVVLTHGHPDHTGALDHIRQVAPGAAVLASPAEGIPDTEPLSDGDVVGTLRAVATPGHTAGHVSLLDESAGSCWWATAWAPWTVSWSGHQSSSPRTAARPSSRCIVCAASRGARMLFAHGPELSRPWDALDTLLGDSSA